MHDELVKKIRHCATDPMHCLSCGEDKDGRCFARLMTQAADAIEALSKLALSEHNRAAKLAWERRWIPVAERLPEKNQIVVVVQRGKTWDYGQFRGLAYLGGNIHKWDWKNNTTKTVDYWMPKKSALPEPPKEG